jgi:hypothetical protein
MMNVFAAEGAFDRDQLVHVVFDLRGERSDVIRVEFLPVLGLDDMTLAIAGDDKKRESRKQT